MCNIKDKQKNMYRKLSCHYNLEEINLTYSNIIVFQWCDDKPAPSGTYTIQIPRHEGDDNE